MFIYPFKNIDSLSKGRWPAQMSFCGFDTRSL